LKKEKEEEEEGLFLGQDSPGGVVKNNRWDFKVFLRLIKRKKRKGH